MKDRLKQFGKQLWWMKDLKSYYVTGLDHRPEGEYFDQNDTSLSAPLHESNLISSVDNDGNYYLMLDIDSDDVYIRESSTPGHYHIAFPNAMTEGTFCDVVYSLYKAGIIADGNFKQYEMSKALFLRTPWTKKGESDTEDTRRFATEFVNRLKDGGDPLPF